MSSRNEESSTKKERRRSTSSRVQLEENVFTTQISHYHQTMGYYSGVSPHFMPDRNCYNNINWSSRAPPWTGWTPPPPATWMASVSNGGMVPTPQPYHCRIPNRLPPSPFNPPAPPPPPMTPQPTPVMDPLLGSMHTPASNNLRGWYARYPNDIPVQDVPLMVPSGQLDNIDCLRHVGNHIRADHNFVEKTLMQKCETTASVCGTTVTRRSWYKMPEKSPPQPTKEKTVMKANDKTENINMTVETSVLPSKVKKMEDAVIMSSDYCSKLSNSNLSSKSSNCLAEVPNHDASSSNFTEYFLKRLMKKHQKESNMKKMPVSDAISSVVQSANILSPSAAPEKHLSHFPVSKNHIRNSHSSKITNRIIEDVIDLSRESPPSSTNESKPTIITTTTITPTSHNNTTTTVANNINLRKNETVAACDLVITNSYSLSFSGSGNAPLSTKRKLPDTKPLTLEDNQKENLIISDPMSDYQMKLTDGRSKRKKYEPRKRDSFIIEDEAPCWISGTTNKLIDTSFHSNDKNALTNNIVEKPNDHEIKCMNKIDGGDNAPEYCDIVDILHSLSESGPNSQRVGQASKNDSLLERNVIQTTNPIRNDSKCITLDDTDDSDAPQSGETLTPCTVIRSRQSLDTLSTEENSLGSIHDSTLSSSSFDNNDVLEERILEKNLRFSPLIDKEYSKNDDNPSLNSSEKSSSAPKKGNIYFAAKEKLAKEKETSSEPVSTKEPTKSTWVTLNVSKPSTCTIPGKIPTLTICKIPKAILPIKKQPIEQRISDEELETLEVLGQNVHAENVAVASSTSCPKEEEQSKVDSPTRDKPENVITVEVEKRLSENATPVKVLDSMENPISIVNDGLGNSEEGPFVGNESDDCLPSGRSLSESPLPEGVGSYDEIADEDAKETAAASETTHIVPQEAEDPCLIKETPDPAPKLGKVNPEDTSESHSQSNSLNDNEQTDQVTSPSNMANSIDVMITSQPVKNLEKNQKQPVVEPHRQKDNSLCHSVLHVEPVTESLFPKNNNVFTLTTSPLKSKNTASLTNCKEMVPTGATTLQQAELEVLSHSEKVLSCNNLKEINQSPCIEISENGDMKVLAIVTDYEESACDNLLGLAGPESELCKNSNIIITAIGSPKKDAVLEYSERPSDPPFKELHKSKMPSLADYEKCKNPKENRSLFSSFLNCHKEKDVFSTTCNGDIVILKDSAPKVQELPTYSSRENQSHEMEDQVVCLEPANSTVDLNIMSVELKQLPPTVDCSANKLELSLVSDFVADVSKTAPAIGNYLPTHEGKTLKRKKKKIKSKNKTKGKIDLKKFKKQKISNKNHRSKKLYRRFKKKSISLGMKTKFSEFRDSLVTCREQDIGQTTAVIKNSKIQPQVASQTELEKYDLSTLRTRISTMCPNRRGRIFHPPQQESNFQIQDNTADCVSSLNKQCQTDNPFYGCLSHAFEGSCYRMAEKPPPPSIIHKFVKFHGHKLLCVTINVKKYVIVRELVQKCFQGKNQVVFYRTKYRDYSFPYLELPFHMKSFVLKYLLESGNLLIGNRTTPLSIMLLSDAEIIYHFFYSFRECSLTACVQDWNSDDTGVYDPDWLKILETASAVSMKTEPPDNSTETGSSTKCACNHANNNFASDVSDQCRAVARAPLKRPMSGIFEPSFESPIFGTTSSSTQTSPSDTNSSSLHPDPVDSVVSTKFIKMDDNPDNSSRDSSNATISLENSLTYSNSLLTLTGVDFMSASSNYCDYVSKPLSSDFVSETHRNDDADDNNSSRSVSLSSQFSSSSLPLEDPSDDGNDTPITPLPLSDTAQTPGDFVLGGMTLLDGKIVRFVELNSQRHFLLTDINSSWTLPAIIDSLLETEIVVHRCTPSERKFILNLNQTLPQANSDEMLLIADESFSRLKTFLSQTPCDNLCYTPPAEHSTPEPERQMQYDIESQSEQNHVFAEEHS